MEDEKKSSKTNPKSSPLIHWKIIKVWSSLAEGCGMWVIYSSEFKI